MDAMGDFTSSTLSPNSQKDNRLLDDLLPLLNGSYEEAEPLFPDIQVEMPLLSSRMTTALQVIFPLLIFLGVLSSSFILLVLRNFGSRGNIFWRMLKVMTLIDVINLLVHCGNQWYYLVYTKQPMGTILGRTDFLCKTGVFVMQSFLQASTWAAICSAGICCFVVLPSARPPLNRISPCMKVFFVTAALLPLVYCTHALWNFYIFRASFDSPNICIQDIDYWLNHKRLYVWQLVAGHLLPLCLLFMAVLVTVVLLIRQGGWHNVISTRYPNIKHIPEVVDSYRCLFVGVLMTLLTLTVEQTYINGKYGLTRADLHYNHRATLSTGSTLILLLFFTQWSLKLPIFLVVGPEVRKYCWKAVCTHSDETSKEERMEPRSDTQTLLDEHEVWNSRDLDDQECGSILMQSVNSV